ncbi:hypothetical protein EUGRSUZ_B00477 [Eucalyptus grandis]|uniref:Uncharacterized protein n=2 Tax=Eucalyptus grandis TaxID=71139 RepID=A0ACC3LMW0_EUCGR|nr:hypothetical protein EUGRSUZ_B00477 [Eucalyptus grandis]
MPSPCLTKCLTKILTYVLSPLYVRGSLACQMGFNRSPLLPTVLYVRVQHFCMRGIFSDKHSLTGDFERMCLWP